LRDYIRDKHLPQPDDQARLVKHFVQLAADLGAQVGSAQGAEAVQRLTPEAANIEAMFSLALEGSYAAEVTQAAMAWGIFVYSTGLGSARPLEQAANRAREHGDTQEVANCINGLGNIAYARSDHGQARERYEQALPLYRQGGYVVGEAICLWGLGSIALAQSDYAISKARYEESLALLRQGGHKHNEGIQLKKLNTRRIKE
jgi:tetratricopeptide (TPR) repeat protein